MRVKEIAEKLGLEVIADNGSGKEVTGGYTSDLLSDVMGNSSEGDMWITMQTHLNVVAVATLKDHSAVLFVGGNRPDSDVIAKADNEGMPLLCSDLQAFELSGRIYAMLKEE